MNDQHRWTTDDDDSRRRRIRQEDQDLWLERRRVNHDFEREMKELEHQHVERIEEIKLEIEQIKAQSTNDDRAGEREYQLDLKGLEGLIERKKLRLTQPHNARTQINETLKEVVKFQNELLDKADRTDFEKEMDGVVSAIIRMFETARSLPAPVDRDGNLDDITADKQYEMVLSLAGELVRARVNSAKKDLAG